MRPGDLGPLLEKFLDPPLIRIFRNVSKTLERTPKRPFIAHSDVSNDIRHKYEENENLNVAEITNELPPRRKTARLFRYHNNKTLMAVNYSNNNRQLPEQYMVNLNLC